MFSKYWEMAGFETKTNLSREVKSLIERYLKMQKDSKKSGLFQINKRAAFQNEGERLFDVGVKNLEEIIRNDKIRNNLSVVEQDLAFLVDQHGERKMTMDKRDLDYEDRRGQGQQKTKQRHPGILRCA